MRFRASPFLLKCSCLAARTTTVLARLCETSAVMG